MVNQPRQRAAGPQFGVAHIDQDLVLARVLARDPAQQALALVDAARKYRLG
ncbi:hypothetical protein GCM10009661_57280 [Catellatospora chokoriensis]|uniref:Uncharacterized protein n=1 Tax=Catellatospora chokoriensis TaxID=310353 RepID=A0A8J3K014_9ACTN|nr:hypothetical protein Cch02nite_38650 [Catellatospora chokoriensis]